MSRRLRSVLAWCLCALCLPFFYWHGRYFAAHSFWDAIVYAKAITSFSHGGTPYITLGNFIFVYPPIVALVGRLLSWLLTPRLGWTLFVLTNMASVVAIPFVMARFYFRRLVTAEVCALFLLAPCFLAEPAFFAGNIAPPCYLAALLAAIPGLERGRWQWFYLITILISNIKITFLVFLLLPFFVGMGQFIPCIATTIATFGAYLLQKLCVPGLYRQFHNALATQTFAGRDYGYGAFGSAANALTRINITGYAIPWAVQILFNAVIVAALWHARRYAGRKDERFLALVLIAVVLSNPRIKEYDLILAIIPAYYLILSGARRPVTWILTAISVSGFFIGHGTLGYLFLLTAAFIVGAIELPPGKPTMAGARIASEAG